MNFVVHESRPFTFKGSHLRRPTTVGDMISAHRYFPDEEKQDTVQEQVSVLEKEDEVAEVEE